MKIISWNINNNTKIWDDVMKLNADFVLLQEAPKPPTSIIENYTLDSADPWLTIGEGNRRSWKTAIIQLTERFEMQA